MIGRTLDRYRIVALLGEGGMGAVYVAEDTTLGREVAIKVLRPGLASNPELVQRFLTEAMTLARLGHPHIATLFELKQDADVVYMAMELVRGDNLEVVRERRGALPWPEVAEIARQVLSALDYAHRRGVVHRDIKPSNLMVDEHGGIKVMDFGIARVLGGAKTTRTGHVVGTAEYMAPEQITGQAIDGRADLYALGIVLYELLTGHGPFSATSDFGLMKAHVETPVPPPGQSVTGLPEWFDEVIVRMLAKAPEERFESAAACRTMIEDALGLSRPVAAAPAAAPGAAVAKATRLATPPTPPPPTREARPTPVASPVGPAVSAGPAKRPQTLQWSWQLGAAAAALLVIVAAPAAWWLLQPATSDEPAEQRGAATAGAAGSGAASAGAAGGAGGGMASRDPDATRRAESPVAAPIVPGGIGAPAAPVTTRPPAPVGPAPVVPGREAAPPPDTRVPSPPAGGGLDTLAAPRDTAGTTSTLKPVVFDRIRLVETEDGKSKEIDVRMTLTGDRLEVTDRKTSKRLRLLRYERINSVSYSFSKHPRWKSGAAAAVAVGVLATPLFFMKSTRHWLTVQAGPDVLILRLDKSNYQTVLPTLEARSGVKVETVEGEESD